MATTVFISDWPRPKPGPPSLDAGAVQSVKVALDESLRPVNSEANTFFAADREHVLDEVIAIMLGDCYSYVLTIPALYSQAATECADQEVACIHSLSRNHVAAPQTGKVLCTRIRKQVGVIVGLGKLND